MIPERCPPVAQVVVAVDDDGIQVVVVPVIGMLCGGLVVADYVTHEGKVIDLRDRALLAACPVTGDVATATQQARREALTRLATAANLFTTPTTETSHPCPSSTDHESTSRDSWNTNAASA